MHVDFKLMNAILQLHLLGLITKWIVIFSWNKRKFHDEKKVDESKLPQAGKAGDGALFSFAEG